MKNNRPLIMAALLSAANLAEADPRDRLPVCDSKNPKAGEFCKCYGAALKGQNDCTNIAGTHSCGGASQEDCDPGEYKVVESPKCGIEQTQCIQEKNKPKGFFAKIFAFFGF